MNEITVFWIEDNPIQMNNDEINGKEYPKLLHQGFFSYCIFQHPMQVKEYLSMIDKLNRTANSLAEVCPKALPDIVVFDYTLSQGIKGDNAGLSYTDDDHYKYLKSTSAGHLLKETFNKLFENKELFLDTEDVKNESYKEDKFKTELNAEKILPDDEFGLYCGIAIIREFKEYITVGVPATINKADKTTLSNNSLFYEWLNSYDLKGAIERPAKKEEMKDWSKILDFSADLIRKRIESQLKSGKIAISYSHLNELTKEVLPNKRVFSFKSAFGTKTLPLDGLFIDSPENERTIKINEWAIKLLQLYVEKTGFTFNEYEVAKTISKTLIKQYQANDEVDKRDRLSELIVKYINGNTKTIDNVMQDLMNHFGITKAKIESFINKEDITYSSLEKNFIDYRDKKTGQHRIDRLIVLFSDLRLHKIYEDFCKRSSKGEQQFYLINQLLDPPTYKELRCVLFPIAQNPLVLPQHELYLPTEYQKKDPFEIWDNHLTKNVMKEFHLLPKSEYPANLSDGEMCICLSFVNEIELSEKFPNWLQK